ncbi:T9SS type A sorting domain-containing protein [Flavobacterium sp.]|uniref:T9SS type A sorting domain-containing protein n=1 Tax=Flavobacterium sp. TaxID=239 RepID=UPI0037BF17E4
MALQSSGKIIIVGAFTKYNGVSTNNIIRLMPNGQVDPLFSIANSINRSISTVIIEPITDNIIIGGEFTTYGSTPVKKMIRLGINGNLDSSFSIGTGTSDSVSTPYCTYCSNRVVVLKQQPDGKIIVGGKFTTFNGLSATNITRIIGSAGVQAKGSTMEFQSEPEIDITLGNKITIYPNPSDGIYYFNLTEEDADTQIQVFNLLGEQVFSNLLLGKQENEIDLSNLAKGCYLVKLSNLENTTTQKLIKK